MACPPIFEIETAESHPDSALITGEWILPHHLADQPGHLPHPRPEFHVWVPEGFALVLGASQTLEREMHVEVWQQKHAGPSSSLPVRLCKRRGGGGAVLLGPHSLCLAMRAPRQNGLGPLDYFGRFNGRLIQIITNVTGITLAPMGISDLAYGDRKVVGSSLYLSREWALYLASVLIKAPADLFDDLLKHPTREPDYRQGRNHRDFITDLAALHQNLKPALTLPPDSQAWVKATTHQIEVLSGA